MIIFLHSFYRGWLHHRSLRDLALQILISISQFMPLKTFCDSLLKMHFIEDHWDLVSFETIHQKKLVCQWYAMAQSNADYSFIGPHWYW